MGILLYDKNADYSATSVGNAGLYTSVTGNLKALHELRRNASKTINNSAPGMLSGSVFGTPTYAATNITTTNANGVIFNSKPANGGLTVAIVVKMKTGGAITDSVVGINNLGAAATVGSLWFYLFNRRIAFNAYSYPAGSVSPLSGYNTISAYQDFTAPSDGLYEMFFGVLENGISLRFYHPKTSTLTTTSATGRDFCFDAPANIQTNPLAGTTAHDQSMFAHWSAVLTPTQMNTFYAEIRDQYALLGLTI